MADYIDLGMKYIVVELDKESKSIQDVLSGPFDTEKEANSSMLTFVAQGKQRLHVVETHVIRPA